MKRNPKESEQLIQPESEKFLRSDLFTGIGNLRRNLTGGEEQRGDISDRRKQCA